MSYLDTITDRPLTERELHHKEFSDVMDGLELLRNDLRFVRLLHGLEGMEGLLISEYKTHAVLDGLTDVEYPRLSEFREALAPYTKRLADLSQVNRDKRVKTTRKGCFELLAYAKKWLGVPMPPNLSKLNLKALRAKVSECYPDGQLPKVTHLSYKGVLAILRGLRLAGHKVTLRAKLPQLLAQVVALVDNWEAQYDILASAGETYARVVEQAKQDLLAVFKPPTVPVVVQETPAQVDSAFGVAQVPFKGLVVQAA